MSNQTNGESAEKKTARNKIVKPEVKTDSAEQKNATAPKKSNASANKSVTTKGAASSAKPKTAAANKTATAAKTVTKKTGTAAKGTNVRSANASEAKKAQALEKEVAVKEEKVAVKVSEKEREIKEGATEPQVKEQNGETAETLDNAEAIEADKIESEERIESKEMTAVETQLEEDLNSNKRYLLRVRNLKKYFPIKKDFLGRPTAHLRAVDDVSFDLERGRTLGIVGESGCGKTTMGRTILKLYQPTDGKIYFDGEDIAPIKQSKLRSLRTRMQIIFQDPYSSLPPRMPVGNIIGEAVKYHKLVSKNDLHSYVLDVMDKCGLRDYYYERYPHEFSGGQRQRICIARALAVKPELIVCDEPVSALDVSIQAQIINLLKDLQQSMGLTYLFISHDLSVVKHISDSVGVMYLGSMVEFGSNKSIFTNPMHPYTRALFSAVPVPDPKVKMNRIILAGDIPSPANPPSGCKFHTRCPECKDICKEVTPVYKEYEEGHFVACHLYPQD